MKKYEIIFADLDGTLIDTLSGKTFPEGIWDMKIKLDVLDKIKELAPKYVLIVTNQGGIEKGFINEWSFRHKLEYICSVINNYCGCETYARYCTVNDANNVYRKPNTGMLEHLMEQYVGDDVNHIKSVSVMIGDASGKEGQFSDSDKKCAENFGIDYIDEIMNEDFVNAVMIICPIIIWACFFAVMFIENNTVDLYIFGFQVAVFCFQIGVFLTHGIKKKKFYEN